MKFIVVILKLIGWVVKTTVILAICSSILFVAYKGNQPMQVPEAPKGMTYFEFVADRIDAAKTPSVPIIVRQHRHRDKGRAEEKQDDREW